MNLDRFPPHFSESMHDDDWQDRADAAAETMADLDREDRRLGQSCSVTESTMLALLLQPNFELNVERRKLNEKGQP